MHYVTPVSLANSLDDISQPRLSSYRTFFNPNSDVELYGTYCWNEALSSCFMRLIGVLEISLRNRFHAALSARVWTPGVSNGSPSSNDWYNHLPLVQKSVDQVKKMTHEWRNGMMVPKLHPPSPNKVIAGLTYGFWSKLLDVPRDNNGVPLDWAQLLVQIVPNHHQKSLTYWQKQPHQDALYARIELVGDLRNRVAHFEPIWKLKELKEEKRRRKHQPAPAIIAPAPATPADAILRLQELYRRTSQLLFWLSKDRAADFADSETNHFAYYLMTDEALARYQQPFPKREERLSCVTKSWGLKLKLRGKAPVWISDKDKLVGRFYPYHVA